MNDHQLGKFVLDCERNGRALGLTTMRAQQFWAYMLLNSRGSIAEDPEVLDYIVSDPDQGTPDDKIYNLMSELADTQT